MNTSQSVITPVGGVTSVPGRTKRRRILLASDHNGNAARAYIIKKLSDIESLELIDLGPGENDGKVDYVDYAHILCESITYPDDRGILICGTGTGMCIAANKHRLIRAGLATDISSAELMREHNDCNVLCLGLWRGNSLSDMDDMVRAFLTTKFGYGRHEPRVAKLDVLDENR